jgi:hypothetical protein
MSKNEAEETTNIEVGAETQVDAADAEDTVDVAGGAENEAGTNAGGEGETPSDGEATHADGEVVVTIGDEAPPQEEAELEQAPAWVKELRKTNREQARRIKELERQQQAKAEATKEVELGPKPKMSDPDIDYDPAVFEEKLNKWNERKRIADEAAAKRAEEERKATEAWQAKLNGYNEAKTKLAVKDFAEAEATALDMLGQVQQGIVVQGAENPALVIYALGKNQAKLKELSSITDPVKFAFAVSKLESTLKVTTRKAPPPPEKVVTGSGPKSGVVDSTLERLRAEAEKTGDYSKVVAHKRKMRAAS